MHNIGRLRDCYGCGVCAIVCPKKIIEIRESPEGFYEPIVVSPAHCTDCGLCLSVCAFNDTKVVAGEVSCTPDGFAAWSKIPEIRQEASSGGIGFMLAKYLIGQGFRACGVRYNPSMGRAEHFIANTVEDYLPSIGSKYIPSYTFNGFSGFNRKDRFLVIGTPCQIDSLRRWIRKTNIERNFILIDFFCHGVPSLNMWRKYLQSVPVQIGNETQIKWRDKTGGWHDSWTMKVTSDNRMFISSFLKDKDLFYRFFLGNVCLGKACYKHCKYKMQTSAADIRIGDLWGSAYKDDRKGVSALLALTTRGKKIIGSLEDCHIEQWSVSLVLEGQMRKSASKPMIYPLIIMMLKGEKSLSEIFIYVKAYNFSRLPVRILRKVKSMIIR